MKIERRNAYFCNSCRRVTISVDVDNGVTPMFHPCVHCKKMATSFMYQVPACLRYDFSNGIKVLPADIEWYKPDEREIIKLSVDENEHVKKGGLLSRGRTNKPAIFIESTRNKNK